MTTVMEPRSIPIRPAAAHALPVAAVPPAANPGFHALLERLEFNTHALERTEREVGDAQGLGRAVRDARISLENALELGAQLLEAYRQELRQKSEEVQP